MSELQDFFGIVSKGKESNILSNMIRNSNNAMNNMMSNVSISNLPDTIHSYNNNHITKEEKIKIIKEKFNLKHGKGKRKKKKRKKK